MELHLSHNSSSTLSSSSFSTFSSENLADIAARVVSELNLHPPDDYDDIFPNDAVEDHKTANNVDEDDDDSEFEFAVLCGGDDSQSPISADEIFYNGQIKPLYPIFDTSLVYPDDAAPQPPTAIRLPLRKLMSEDRETAASSSSSSEADDLEGVPQGTYCVWTPPKTKNGDGGVLLKKKSNSTGSNNSNSDSKRWKIKDLLYSRSKSDGKDAFVFLNADQVKQQQRREKVTAAKKKRVGGERKSYLPYRQDLVGLFANVNGISRTVRPF